MGAGFAGPVAGRSHREKAAMRTILPVAMAGAFLLGWALWGFDDHTHGELWALAIILSFVFGHVLRGIWH